MNIVCCVKQVPDPETPTRVFKVDEAARQVIPAPGNPPVISQFDQIAVEAALRIKDARADDTTVTILSLGPDSARDAIKTCLAMGADEGVLLNDPILFGGDSHSSAVALAAAIQKLGDVDLVLCGRQAVDTDSGVTGLVIAELLGIPSVSIAKSVSVVDGKLQAQRVLTGAFETVEIPTPCVVTVGKDLGEPRYPTLPQIMQAARKQITVWTAADLGLGPDQAGASVARLNLEALYIPQIESRCEFIEGDTPQQMAVSLARTLHEANLI